MDQLVALWIGRAALNSHFLFVINVTLLEIFLLLFTQHLLPQSPDRSIHFIDPLLKLLKDELLSPLDLSGVVLINQEVPDLPVLLGEYVIDCLIPSCVAVLEVPRLADDVVIEAVLVFIRIWINDVEGITDWLLLNERLRLAERLLRS